MADQPGDVLVSGSERAPGLWRRVPPRLGVGVALLAVLGTGLVTVATGAAEPEVVPPAPLGALGPAGAQVHDGGLLVRVEAELRTREPVVLRSGTVTGGGVVVLVDPVPEARPGAPGAVRQRVVALVDPRCARDGPPGPAQASALEVVVAPQSGGQTTTLRSEIPPRPLAAAAATACLPVRATVSAVPDGDPAARQVEVAVELVDRSVPTTVLGLTGRGLRVELPAALRDGPVPAGRTTAPAQVIVTDCSVEVLAPRRLVLEVERDGERLQVPAALSRAAVAGLDELVRQTCRRPRL